MSVSLAHKTEKSSHHRKAKIDLVLCWQQMHTCSLPEAVHQAAQHCMQHCLVLKPNLYAIQVCDVIQQKICFDVLNTLALSSRGYML